MTHGRGGGGKNKKMRHQGRLWDEMHGQKMIFFEVIYFLVAPILTISSVKTYLLI